MQSSDREGGMVIRSSNITTLTTQASSTRLAYLEFQHLLPSPRCHLSHPTSSVCSLDVFYDPTVKYAITITLPFTSCRPCFLRHACPVKNPTPDWLTTDTGEPLSYIHTSVSVSPKPRGG